MCVLLFFSPELLFGSTHTSTPHCCFVVAETNKTDPTQYLLTLEQMIENDYPIPSYMADVFEKSTGWMETPQLAENESKWNQKIYAIDCEMVRDTVISCCPFNLTVTSLSKCITEDGKELTRSVV